MPTHSVADPNTFQIFFIIFLIATTALDSIYLGKYCGNHHQLQVLDQNKSIYLDLVHPVPGKGLARLKDSGWLVKTGEIASVGLFSHFASFWLLFQIFYVMSTILGPATIIIAISDALNAVTDNSLW